MKKQEKMERYRRVTEILSPFTDFSMIAPHVLENAADRGSRTHHFCELYIKNLLIEPVDEDCKPYFESFVQWYDFVVDKVLHVEKRFYCDDWRITGQVDLICKLKNSDSVYIVDLKTPQSSSKTWQLQTAAYKYLAEKNLGIEIDYRGCLMLRKDGEVPKMCGYPNHKEDLELFFSACKLNSFFGG